MGFIQVWLSYNQLLKLCFFLCFFQITCLQALLCTQEQSSALIQFKRHFSFNKSASAYCDHNGILSYPKMESWIEGTDCCSWDGVKCHNETGQVIGLDLNCSWLEGTIHPNSSLFLLPHLQNLNLAFNYFNFRPMSPAFGRFTRLRHLNLSDSGFFGKVPIEISFLNKLVSLDLSDNDLRFEKGGFELLAKNLTMIKEIVLDHVNISSVVPKSLLNLTSLISLNLNGCGLYGKFPIGIFQLPHLEDLCIGFNYDLRGYFPKFINSSSRIQHLGLQYTGFSGELPDSIGNLKSLKELVAFCDELYGSIPMSLGNLSQITWLDLSFNNFTGMLPSSLSKIKSLIVLDLSNNYFQGTIVDVLPYSNNLAYLYLDLNNFSRPFPSLVANLTELLHFDVSNNHLTGPLPPQLTVLPNLYSLDISQNLINGTIPSWVYALPALLYLDFCYNKLIGHVDEFRNALLRIVDLSNNNLHGTVPSSIFQLMNITHLILSSNNFSGCIPKSNNFSEDLIVLDLRKNIFSGNIPDIFTRGNSLKTINFNGNGFEGPIPKSLVNCKKLEVLDLGNNKLFDKFPHWLENMPNLHVLILRSNKFHGPMPTSKSKFPFPHLRVIDLSNNCFTGPLPKGYFKNFKDMMNVDEKNFELQYMGKYIYSGNYYHDSLTIIIKGSTIEMVKVLTIFTAIDLSKNKFEGEIPDIIGRLNSTRGLNLSHNSLIGHIPTSFGNLMTIEWLDLSSNKLIGDIPQQLTNLKFLEVLNFSQNQLTGPIPHGNQFDTFSNDSYIGNLALCGPPLSNTCNNHRALQPPLIFEQDEDSQNLNGFDWEVILPGYGCGLVFGLVTGYLMFSIGKPLWLMRIIEVEWNKGGRRLKKLAHRHRG